MVMISLSINPPSRAMLTIWRMIICDLHRFPLRFYRLAKVVKITKYLYALIEHACLHTLVGSAR
jgi:hypothetical protein